MIALSFLTRHSSVKHKNSMRLFVRDWQKIPVTPIKWPVLYSAAKIHIEFLCGRAYIPDMEMQGAMARTGMFGVPKAVPKRPADQRETGYWPEWIASVEDDATLNNVAQKNAPRIVFGEAARVLAVIGVVVAIINVALGAFHIH